MSSRPVPNWGNESEEFISDHLNQEAIRYEKRLKTVARRFKKKPPEKMKVLDPTTGQLLNLTVTEASDYMKKLQAKEAEERNRKEESKNLNFIQLKKGIAPEVISAIAEESSVAVQVLMFFFKNMSSDGVLVVSQTTICDALDKSRQGINKAVKVLEKNRAIARGKVGGKAVVYIINPEVAWQQSHLKKKILYAQGVVMLNADENKDIFEKFEGVNQLELRNLEIKAGNARIARSESKNRTISTGTKTVPLEIEIDHPEDFGFDELPDDEFGELQPGERPPENY